MQEILIGTPADMSRAVSINHQATHRSRNRLLCRLGEDDHALLSSHLEPWTARQGEVLARDGEPMPHIFFPERGVVAMLVHSPDKRMAEAGLIGREGCIHPAMLLGSDRLAWDALVQMPCEGVRVSRTSLLHAMDASASLRRTLLLFAHAQAVQSSFTALSNTIHSSEERLARWLLMAHDRSDGDDLSVTHEILAMMLGVRRPTVTNAVHVLEGRRLIRSARGTVQIRDRAELETFAAPTYGRPEAEYDRLLGPT